MRGMPIMATLLLMVFGCPTAHGATEKRVALVIGVGRYQNAPALTNPTNDARLLAPALKQLDFDVEIVIDPDYETLKRALRDFNGRLEGAAVGLFYYAGHGLQVAGQNYLLPVNAALTRENDLRYEAFDMQAVLNEMEAPGRVNLIFLDACRDNPLARSLAARMGGRSAAVDRGLARIDTHTGGSLIAYATAPGDIASDGTGRNSPFTASLVRRIATPGLDVRQMLTKVRGDVQAATSGKQRPWVNESLDADFYFVPRATSVPGAPEGPPPPPVPPVSPEIMLWRKIEASGNLSDYLDYLRAFPSGAYADEAQRRILALGTRSAPAPSPPPSLDPPPYRPPSSPTRLPQPKANVTDLGRWTTQSVEQCRISYYSWRIMDGMFRFQDQTGQIDTERVIERRSGFAITETVASVHRRSGHSSGTRWTYQFQGDNRVIVTSREAGKLFTLTRCP